MHIPQLGELKSSTTRSTMDLNMFSQDWMLLGIRKHLTDDLSFSFFWGPTKRTWDLAGGYKEDGTKVCSMSTLAVLVGHKLLTSGAILR